VSTGSESSFHLSSDTSARIDDPFGVNENLPAIEYRAGSIANSVNHADTGRTAAVTFWFAVSYDGASG
jgi:hypothetical protein